MAETKCSYKVTAHVRASSFPKKEMTARLERHVVSSVFPRIGETFRTFNGFEFVVENVIHSVGTVEESLIEVRLSQMNVRYDDFEYIVKALENTYRFQTTSRQGW